MLEKTAADLVVSVHGAYESREYGRALRECMAFADWINHYFDANQPWVLAKDPSKAAQLQDVCSRALFGFKVLSVLLAPVLPELSRRAARELFGLDGPFTWADAAVLPQQVGPYQHLMQRVDLKQLDALFEADTAEGTPPKVAAPKGTAGKPPAPAAAAAPTALSIDEFKRVDLRVARIVEAAAVEGSDKLLRLTLDLGTEQRTVFAGIKAAYDPAQLTGRLTVMVANLAPRKMKFGVSQGMVLAASNEAPGLYLLAPDSGAAPGMRIS